MSAVSFVLHTPTESIHITAFAVPRIGEEVIYKSACWTVTNVILDCERSQTGSGITVVVTPKAG